MTDQTQNLTNGQSDSKNSVFTSPRPNEARAEISDLMVVYSEMLACEDGMGNVEMPIDVEFDTCRYRYSMVRGEHGRSVGKTKCTWACASAGRSLYKELG